MDDLIAIASMEYGKAMQVLSKERDEAIRKAINASAARGGFGGHAVTEIEIHYAEKSCKILADIWVELFESRNNGRLTRQNVDYIKARVREVAASRKSGVINAPNRGAGRVDAGAIARGMETTASNVLLDLELRFRRQEAGLPKKNETPGTVNLAVGSAANINLGTQVGTINAALTVVTEQGHREVAAAIEELTEAVSQNAQLEDKQRQEILEVIEVFALQAKSRPESRSTGLLKTLIYGFPGMLGIAADLVTLWDKYGPILRTFFGV